MKRLRDVVLATTLTAASSSAIAAATRKIRRNYFPLADEWSILASSHPRVARPRSWFTEGFRDYFKPPSGLPDPQGTTFTRPLFNATYWAVGQVAEPESERYLRIGNVAFGVCAGVTALAIARSGGSTRSAAISGALMPLMPALVPSMTPLTYPCMAFDAITACFSQGATTAYDNERRGRAAAFLATGLLTKETALPTAGVLPVLYLWEHKGKVLRDPKALRTLVALAAPAAAWYGLRRVTFRGVGVKESAYVLDDDPRGRIRRQLRIASKFPFWTSYAVAQEPGWSPAKAAAGAQFAANALVVGGATIEIASRLRAGERLSADEGSMLASYAFLLIVGTNPRYGVTLDMSLLTNLARWRQAAARPSLATRAITAGVAAGVTGDIVRLARDYPRMETNYLAYAEVGRKYLAALRQFGPGDRVLVLNDPVTFWAQVNYLTRTMGIEAEVVKLADYPYSIDLLDGVTAPSSVTLEPPATPAGLWRFTQAQGIDILSAHKLLDAAKPFHVDYGDGITIDLEPAPADAAPMVGHQRWAAMHISTGNRPAHLLYYDPTLGEFQSISVPAAASGCPDSSIER